MTPRYRVGRVVGGGGLETTSGKRNSISDDPSLVKIAIGRFSAVPRPAAIRLVGGACGFCRFDVWNLRGGNPSVRGQNGQDHFPCAWMRNVPYFAPRPHDRDDDSRKGGAKEGPSPQIHQPEVEFAPHLEKSMRTSMHLRFLLGLPRYSDFAT